jgi:hypothetical protein
VKILRSILLALLLSLLLGLAIGTALRLRLERPIVYLMSALLPPLPLDVGHARAVVLDPRHHEEQVG